MHPPVTPSRRSARSIRAPEFYVASPAVSATPKLRARGSRSKSPAPAPKQAAARTKAAQAQPPASPAVSQSKVGGRAPSKSPSPQRRTPSTPSADSPAPVPHEQPRGSRASSSRDGFRICGPCLATTVALLALVLGLGAQWVVDKAHSNSAFMHTLQVSNGYGSKLSCSQVFLANRSQHSVDTTELLFPPVIFFSRFAVHVDGGRQCVTGTSRLNRGLSQTACLRSRHLGCVLVQPKVPGALTPADPLWAPDLTAAASTPTSTPTSAQQQLLLPWPWGEAAASAEALAAARAGANMTRVAELADAHFADAALHARALLVIKDGERLGSAVTALAFPFCKHASCAQNTLTAARDWAHPSIAARVTHITGHVQA